MRLFRRSEADAWWCDFWHQGRRVRKSTGTTDRREAQEYADRLKAELWRYADSANVLPLHGTPPS